MTIARDEIFGPVLSVMPYDDPDELVARANDTEYGLAACVWTRDVALGHSWPRRSGPARCSSTAAQADPAAPWGGFKSSGWGREMTAEALDPTPRRRGCGSTSAAERRPAPVDKSLTN